MPRRAKRPAPGESSQFCRDGYRSGHPRRAVFQPGSVADGRFCGCLVKGQLDDLSGGCRSAASLSVRSARRTREGTPHEDWTRRTLSLRHRDGKGFTVGQPNLGGEASLKDWLGRVDRTLIRIQHEQDLLDGVFVVVADKGEFHRPESSPTAYFTYWLKRRSRSRVVGSMWPG